MSTQLFEQHTCMQIFLVVVLTLRFIELVTLPRRKRKLKQQQQTNKQSEYKRQRPTYIVGNSISEKQQRSL